MKRFSIFIILLVPLLALAASQDKRSLRKLAQDASSVAFPKRPKEKPKNIASIPKHFAHRLYQIWSQGENELYITGYAWHNRYTYKMNIKDRFNELAWGAGLGKGFFDEDSDWHGLYAMAFLDSHKKIEPTAGYAFLKVIRLNKHAYFGGGFTLLATSRVDINHNIPIIGILPLVSLRFDQASIYATYVPGTYHTGNVLFVFGKWSFHGL